MSLRRSTRRSSGFGDTAEQQQAVDFGDETTTPLSMVYECQKEHFFKKYTVNKKHKRDECQKEHFAKNNTEDKLADTKMPHEESKLVGVSVEPAPKTLHSSIVDDNKKDTNNDSVQTSGTLSTESVISCSTSSSSFDYEGTDERPAKRKNPSLSSSSFSSLASDMLLDDPHPPKKKAKSVPLFKKKLKIPQLTAPSKTDCTVATSKLAAADEDTSMNDPTMHKAPSPNAADAKHTPNTCKPTVSKEVSYNEKWKIDESQVAIQQLLTIAKLRTQISQTNLTLGQLKHRARQKAKARSKKRVQPKRKNGRKAKKQRKSKSPASNNDESEKEEEPSDVVAMETGVLYLYRGDNPRAKFIRRYARWWANITSLLIQ